jgi:DNA-binding NarL/FixJ family response regulator
MQDQRILVVDDHEIVRAGLRSVLAGLDWVSRCVGAENCAEAVEMTRRYEPQVALVDLYVAEESGLEICKALVEADPTVKVLLMSGAGCLTPAVARAAGASGFVTKGWPVERLVEAVRLAAQGRLVFVKQAEDRSAADLLTARERDVLRELARGLSNPEVANELNLSRHTVKQHTSALYRKLGVRNRAEAASRAQQLGLAT